jgi:hypothetical protein
MKQYLLSIVQPDGPPPQPIDVRSFQSEVEG